MITSSFAKSFAEDWVNSWNAHDIDKLLLLYADDFVIETPRALEVMPESLGIVSGKEAVKAYWLASMKLRPGLHFQLLDVLTGINGLSIYYLNTVTNKKSVEVISFNSEEKVNHISVYYIE